MSGIAHFAEKPKGPLQKAAEASSATVPTDAATIPPGGQTSATIPPEAAQPAGIPAGTVPAGSGNPTPAAGIASDRSEHASRAGESLLSRYPLPNPSSNQAESAGVPVASSLAFIDQRRTNPIDHGSRSCQEWQRNRNPQPAEPGQQAKPASVSDSARLDWEKDGKRSPRKRRDCARWRARRRPEPHQADRPGRADGGGERRLSVRPGQPTRIP